MTKVAAAGLLQVFPWRQAGLGWRLPLMHPWQVAGAGG
jgi:hypothetical protein